MAGQAIGVDIGTHAAKIAVLQKKGATTRAIRLFRATLAGDEDRVRLQGALARAGIRGGPALLGITGRDLIVRYTHVPTVPDWRLRLLMQFEINEVSGQSGGEVAADFRRLNLPVEGDEDTVLVALARNTWLSPRLDAARGVGIRAGGGCPNSVALFNAFLAHGQWKEGETTYLVSLGRDNIDMAIQRDGELLFARNMAGGGHMFTEAIMGTFGLPEAKAEKNKVTKGDLTPKGRARYADSTAEKLANAMLGPAGQLVSMIQSTVMIGRAQTKMTDLNVDRLVLTGGGARLKGIREYFEANMSVPVELFDPVSKLDTSALPAPDAEELGEVPMDFAVAVGLAETMLHSGAMPLEVLTEKEKKKRHFFGRTVWAIGGAAAALVLVVLLFKTRGEDIDVLRADNERLQGKLEKAQKDENVQKAAVAAERDWRRKEVALRCRRLAGEFTRTVLDALARTHVEHLYLDQVRMTTEPKVSLDLDGRPSEDRATGGVETAGRDHLFQQQVWPSVKVDGTVQKEYTPNPGTTLNAYSTRLKQDVAALKVAGWPVDVGSTSLDRNDKFSLTFRLLAGEGGDGKAE